MTTYRKGQRVYSNSHGFATVEDGRTRNQEWADGTVDQIILIRLDTGGGQPSAKIVKQVKSHAILVLTPESEKFFKDLREINYQFMNIAIHMLTHGSTIEDVRECFRRAARAAGRD